jgi:hypothetical protein
MVSPMVVASERRDRALSMAYSWPSGCLDGMDVLRQVSAMTDVDLLEVLAVWGWYKSCKKAWEFAPQSTALQHNVMKAYAEYECFQALYWSDFK